MISQFYVLSPRGDTIINRDFRGDIVKGTAEIFYRNVKCWPGDPPPVFPIDGIVYMFLKRNGLYFVATTQQNVSASYCLELLQQVCFPFFKFDQKMLFLTTIYPQMSHLSNAVPFNRSPAVTHRFSQMTKLFKDFCGVLNEEAIRRNFVLIYEVLDEILDCGYPQQTTTENLKQCVHNEAVIVEQPKTIGRGLAGLGTATPFPNGNPKTVPSNASHRPIGAVQQSSPFEGAMRSLTRGTLGGGRLLNKNEIFVDILERLTVVLNSCGQVLNTQIDGCVQMKSYLAGSPPLRLALNEDLVIKNEGTRSGRYAGDPPQLDDCNFHECAELKDFESHRVITIKPPDGEFVVMNYR